MVLLKLMNLQKAKRLFFQYDGLCFHIWHDGCRSVEATYLLEELPKSLRLEWLEELTALKLKKLGSRGNWRVVSFLVDHRDKRHLIAAAAAIPLGVFWEKCSYLEYLLKYVKLCLGRFSATRLANICDDVQQQALPLRRRVRAEISVSRVDLLIQDAKKTCR